MSNKTIHFKTEIVNGLCPECDEDTILISISSDIFQCTRCDHKLEQKINGKISYIPVVTNVEIVPELKLKS
jgi:ribosomal protein L37AE/L43A